MYKIVKGFQDDRELLPLGEMARIGTSEPIFA